MTAALLEVEHLSVEFATSAGWVRVVDDVSFTIDSGNIVGLVGETGSGKSITARAIMGLVPSPPGRVAGGRVSLNGTDVTKLRRRELEDIRGNDIAMISQEPMTSLNPAFTVGEQIAETVRRHRRLGRREAWSAAVGALEGVGIPHAARRAHAYPHEFSGGMRQRVAIAMALSCEPELVIADEPTTALDVTTQAQILDLIGDMRDAYGLSILFITHDLGVVADICDRVIVMYAGQVVEEAGVYELFGDPQHPYSDGLLQSRVVSTAEPMSLHVIEGQPPVPGAFGSGCRFHPRCPLAGEECTTGDVALAHPTVNRSARCLRVRAHDELTTPVGREE